MVKELHIKVSMTGDGRAKVMAMNQLELYQAQWVMGYLIQQLAVGNFPKGGKTSEFKPRDVNSEMGL